MKRITVTLKQILWLALPLCAAPAFPITATLTADNFYGLYHGQQDGTDLIFVGRNEMTPEGNPGSKNWSLPEVWEFDAPDFDYIYVVAWDDPVRDYEQALLGQFLLDNGDLLLTNLDDWQYYVIDKNQTDPLTGQNMLPDTALLSGIINGAAWNQPQAAVPNGSDPWGVIPGISDDANFIWADTLESDSPSDGSYVIYRIGVGPYHDPETTVPEPATLALFGLGLAGLAATRRLRRR